jgi:cyclopropane fatty-acyl-phospholipid synthase-like methyltransferase
MERSEWLIEMRNKTEALYDRFSTQYWVKFGVKASETHQKFLQIFLEKLHPNSTLLSAGCGAGLHDGVLVDAGHKVVGIDLSAGMLSRAKEHFPMIQYKKMGLQEMNFLCEFEGITCIDALEHVFPEDWPEIMQGFQDALKPNGILYFTLDVSATEWLEEEFQRAKQKGLPAVFGEVVADVDEAYETVMVMDDVPGELGDKAVYHYYPSVDQVHKWLDQHKFVVEAEGTGKWYKHFVARKN